LVKALTATACLASGLLKPLCLPCSCEPRTRIWRTPMPYVANPFRRDGEFSAGGSETCVPCPVDTFAPRQSVACTPCPANTTTDGTTGAPFCCELTGLCIVVLLVLERQSCQ
jgi:hypothetical protein